MVVLPFIPETPRWLFYRGRRDEALSAIAATHANGNREDPLVLLTYKEIIDTISEETNNGKELDYRQLVKSKQELRRLMLCVSVAIITMASGSTS